MFWCAGMYASGSTWAYNAMREIAGVLHPGSPVQGRFVNTLADMDGLADGVQVVKSHDMDDETAIAMRALADGIVVTYRDPRDAVTSLMLYQRFPFETAVAWVARSMRFVAGMSRQAHAALRYEDGFADDPETLDTLAAVLGDNLAAEERARIFAGSRREAVEQLIGDMTNSPEAIRDARSGDIQDPQTQWHLHHRGRSGEIGRWKRMLSAAQVAAVEHATAAEMAQLGYEKAPAPSAAFAGPVFGLGYRMTVGTMGVVTPRRLDR